MFIFLLLIFILFTIVVVYLYDKHEKKKLIREPTRKILQLIKEGRFLYEGVVNKGQLSYILKDLETSRKTTIETLFLYNEHDIKFSGDLSWMNNCEREIVASLIIDLVSKKKKEVEKEQRKITEKLNEERRKEAMEVYK